MWILLTSLNVPNRNSPNRTAGWKQAIMLSYIASYTCVKTLWSATYSASWKGLTLSFGLSYCCRPHVILQLAYEQTYHIIKIVELDSSTFLYNFIFNSNHVLWRTYLSSLGCKEVCRSEWRCGLTVRRARPLSSEWLNQKTLPPGTHAASGQGLL